MRVTILLALFFISSCKEQRLLKCSTEMIAAKEDLESQFLKLNNENLNLEFFKKSLKSFLENFKDKNCKIQKNEFHPHEEIRNMITEIESRAEQISKNPEKVIYGDDDRVEVMEHEDERIAEYSKSIAALVEEKNLSDSLEFIGETFKETFSLCSETPFEDQKVIAGCTGFLVDDDVILTAGHCVRFDKMCDRKKWIFGFYESSTHALKENIYSCSKIIKRVLDSETKLDYALVKLDRAVKDRKVLQFRTEGRVSIRTPLVVIGHPSGLSMKAADNAVVRRNSKTNSFEANLDAFSGNSGSPVINLNDGVVEGILVRGEQDFIQTTDEFGKTCSVSNVCSDSGCAGEESTRITKVLELDYYKLQGLKSDYEFLFYDSFTKQEHFPLNLSVKKDFKYNLAGRKFLNSCITHIYNRYTHEWIYQGGFKCSEENFSYIYETYKNLKKEEVSLL